MLNILFGNRYQAYSFIDSGVVDSLIISGINVQILVLDRQTFEFFKTQYEGKYKVILLPRVPKLYRSLEQFLQNLKLWLGRKRALPYAIRAEAQFSRRNSNVINSSVINFSIQKYNLIYKWAVRVGAKKGLIKSIEKIVLLLRIVLVQRVWRIFWSETRLTMVIFSATNSLDYPLGVWLSRRLGIPSIALQHNWDNPSSKYFASTSPDFFGVWGNQAISHLLTYSEVTSKFLVFGSPRSKYYKNLSLDAVERESIVELVKKQEVFTILVVGTGSGDYDLTLLKETLQSVQRILDSGLKLKILYRPHPFSRNKVHVFNLQNNFPKFTVISQEELLDYGLQARMVVQSSVIVTLASTMVLEGLTFGNRVCYPMYIGGDKSYNFETMLNHAPHFDGIRRHAKFIAVEDPDSFAGALMESCNSDSGERKITPLDSICPLLNYEEELKKAYHEITQNFPA